VPTRGLSSAVPPVTSRLTGHKCAIKLDHSWRLANELGARVIIPIAHRYCGLRDFTIADPNGFGIRFASLLPGRTR
jgi:hypothetical protein